jgi:hypothetical protein
VELSEALRKYQAAAEYYGQTQLDIAAASEHFQQATTAQQNAYRVLQTAEQELLRAARDLQLPKRDNPPEDPRTPAVTKLPARPVKDNPQA